MCTVGRVSQYKQWVNDRITTAIVEVSAGSYVRNKPRCHITRLWLLKRGSAGGRESGFRAVWISRRRSFGHRAKRCRRSLGERARKRPVRRRSSSCCSRLPLSGGLTVWPPRTTENPRPSAKSRCLRRGDRRTEASPFKLQSVARLQWWDSGWGCGAAWQKSMQPPLDGRWRLTTPTRHGVALVEFSGIDRRVMWRFA